MYDLTIGVPHIVFSLVAVAAYVMLSRVNPYQARVNDRVKQLEPPSSTKPTTRDVEGDETVGLWTRFLTELQNLSPSQSSGRSGLQQRFSKAGIYDPGAITRYLAAKVLLTIGLAATMIPVQAAGYLSLTWSVVCGCLLAGIGSILPSFWLDRAIARQHNLLQRSLPDLLDLMTVCLGGGLSLQQTILQVGDELRIAHPALAAELGIIQRDMELGATVDQALRRFASRTDYEGIRTLSTFIREAQRFGTNIVDALRSHADMLRTQREQAAEEKAQKASVKILIPTMLLIFPAIFVILVGPAAIQIQEAFAAK